MTGHNYPDNLYADHEERKARRSQQPTGAYRSTDAVNNPSHYTFGKVECIDAIESALSPEEFRGFLKGQVIKYVWRNGRKGDPREDAAKGEWYQRRLNQLLSGKSPNQAEACNPAAMREAKVAYDVACDGQAAVNDEVSVLATLATIQHHYPKWDVRWGSQQGTTFSDGLQWNGPAPPNCDGQRHPMQAEALRDHDERLAGGESHL